MLKDFKNKFWPSRIYATGVLASNTNLVLTGLAPIALVSFPAEHPPLSGTALIDHVTGLGVMFFEIVHRLPFSVYHDYRFTPKIIQYQPFLQTFQPS